MRGSVLCRPALRLAGLCVAVFFAAESAYPQNATSPDAFQPLHFLIGTWTGQGKSDSGAIQGTTTFSEELQGHVLVRRDSSTFPNAGSKSAPYEQMMVIAPDLSGNGSFQASYWDSMGHAIEYAGTVSTISGMPEVQFLSPQTQNTPKFRLTYTAVSVNRLHTVFDIEFPGAAFWHTVADGYSVRAGTAKSKF